MKRLLSIMAISLLSIACFARSPTYYTVISIKGEVLAETAAGEEIALRVGRMLASNVYISVGADSKITLSEHGALVTFVGGTIGKLDDLVKDVTPPSEKIKRDFATKAVQEKKE